MINCSYTTGGRINKINGDFLAEMEARFEPVDPFKCNSDFSDIEL